MKIVRFPPNTPIAIQIYHFYLGSAQTLNANFSTINHFGVMAQHILLSQ